MREIKEEEAKSLLKQELQENDFRVVVFGSARLKEGDDAYGEIFRLGTAVGALGADIVTGGGPGLMEAANKGYIAGRSSDEEDAHSIGIRIQLPFEEVVNKHVDIAAEHERFSSRLDMFMALSNIVVVAPGGVGTLLELAYTWQLVQVGHVCKIPIVLMGDMWDELIKWSKKYQLANGLVSAEDYDFIECVSDCDGAIKLVKKTYEAFEEGKFDECLNWEKYSNS